MSNHRPERIERIPTREATTEQLEDLKKHAKEKYLNLQYTRKAKETRVNKTNRYVKGRIIMER